MTDGDQVGVQRVRLTTLKDGAASSVLFGKQILIRSPSRLCPLPLRSHSTLLSFFFRSIPVACCHSLTFIFMLLVFLSELFLVVIISLLNNFLSICLWVYSNFLKNLFRFPKISNLWNLDLSDFSVVGYHTQFL